MHLFSFFHSPGKHKIPHRPNDLIKIELDGGFPKSLGRRETGLLNFVLTLLKSGNLKWPELDS